MLRANCGINRHRARLLRTRQDRHAVAPYCGLMTQPGWSAQLTRLIAGQVRRYRRRRGMSAQDLADCCAKLGLEISRSTLADLENGRRAALTVAELFVFSAALGVPPIELALPAGRQNTVEIVPGLHLPMRDAIGLLRGYGVIMVKDGTPVFIPEKDMDQELGLDGEELGVSLVDLHDALVHEWLLADGLIRRLMESADQPRSRANERGESLRALQWRQSNAERELAEHRALMRDRGLIVPPLPPELPDVDKLAGRAASAPK